MESATQNQDSVENDEKEHYEFLIEVLEVHEQLLDNLNYDEMNRIVSNPEKVKEYLGKEIQKILKKTSLKTERSEEEFIQAVINEIIGFGPIEPLLHDATVTDIFVNSPTKIFNEQKGKVQKSSLRFLNGEHVYRLVQRIASRTGKHLDLGRPYLDAQLPDGSRLHAIIPPVAIDGAKVSIRKFFFNKLDIDQLVKWGSMTTPMAKLLQLAVRARFNIVVCGGTGSGKTTLLNSLLDSIRGGERVITIEDTPELEPTHPHTIRLITRAPNPEGKGAVTLEHLMINALRMRPDRVILGELRGSEAFNMLHAMNTGQDGSMATLHASGTEEVLARLLNMILMAKYDLSVESIRQQIAGALDLVVYVARLVDGSRRVMSISQISRDDNHNIKVDTLFEYQIDSISEHELIGKHVQFNPPKSKRAINKLVSAGVFDEFQELFSNLEEPSP